MPIQTESEPVSYTHLDVYKRQRLCNAENQYAIVRNSLDMDMRHIDYLCREIKSIRKGSIETIRILGGCLLYTSRCV